MMIKVGRYKGQPFEALEQDKRYVSWLLDTDQKELPRGLRKAANKIEKEHGGVLVAGKHKHEWFDEIYEKHPDYGEWAAHLTDPGPMKKFSAFAQKRLADEDEASEPKHKKQKDDEPTEAKKCVVCMTAPPEACFVPCGHMVACLSCAFLVERDGCPMCREYVAMYLKVYT